MSRIEQCLNAKVEGGRLSREQAERALRHVHALEAEYAKSMTASAAERAAAARAAKEAARAAAEQQRRTALRTIALKRAKTDVEAHPKGAAAGAMSVLSFDRWGLARWANVETRRDTLLGLFQGKFKDGIRGLGPRWLKLVQRKAELDAFVRELFGEGRGNAVAARAAAAWGETADFARRLAVQAGADIRELTSWRLPQSHNRERIRAAGLEAWRAFVLPRLDRSKMRNAETGELLSEDGILRGLELAWHEIVTGGLAGMEPGAVGKASLAKQMGRHRYLHFKDATGWLEYQRRFGEPDTYALLMDHLREMATKVALLQRLGPNPEATLRYLEDLVAKGAAERAAAGEPKAGRWWNAAYPLATTYARITGELDTVTKEFLPGASRFMQGVRNWLTGAQLGSAFLNALVTDPMTVRAMAKMNGLPMARLIENYVRLFNPASAADRETAALLGVVHEDAMSFAFGASRYQDEVMGRGLSAHAADLPLRLSGLTGHTEAWRRAYVMTWLGELGAHAEAGRAFGQLPEATRATFARYGLGEAEWNQVLAAPRHVAPGGRAFVDPLGLMGLEGAQKTALRLMDMLNQERDAAVVGPSAQSFALLMLGSEGRRGTPAGEAARSVAMYKQYGASLLLRHMAVPGGWSPVAARYAVRLALGLTLGGALAVQLRELANGRDPRDMTDPSFWLAAMAAGGGLTIFGDFAYTLFRSGEARTGQGPVVTALGPVAGLADLGIRFVASNTSQALEGERTNAGREAMRLIRQNTPGANLWYARLVLGRLFFDEVQKQVDPDAARSFRRMEQRAREDYGQAFWWRPGRDAPERAPDLGAVAGGD